MFNLFTRTNFDIINYPIKLYPRWNYLKQRYIKNTEDLLTYYNNKVSVVNNRHLLSKIIDICSPDIHLNLYDYYKTFDPNVPYYGAHFGLVSNIRKGRIQDNLFTSNSKDVLILTEQDNDISKINLHWKTSSPLKIIYTEDTDLDYSLLNGNKSITGDITSLFITELDMRMLLIMYRAWAKDRELHGYSTDANRFIASIVIPNAWRKYLDLVLFNRFMTIFYQGECRDYDIKHPIPIVDYSRGIDTIYKQVIDSIKTGAYPVVQLMKMIPTVYYKSMLDALRINYKSYTMQSEWVRWLGRIKYVNFLLDLMGKRGYTRNREYITPLRYKIRELENRSTMINKGIGDKLMTNFNNQLDVLKSKI